LCVNGKNLKTLVAQRPTLLTLYFTSLVIVWLAATIANLATIFGYQINPAGLVGISVFVGVMLVRSFKKRAD